MEVKHKEKSVSSVEYLQTTCSPINCTNYTQESACLLLALFWSGYKFKQWPEIKQVPMSYPVPLTHTSTIIPKLLETYSEGSEKCGGLKGTFYKVCLQQKCPTNLIFLLNLRIV